MYHGLRFAMSLLPAVILLAGGGASAKTVRTYHIGCSTTDNMTQCADPTGFAKSLGNTHIWTKCTRQGCGMECVYINSLIIDNKGSRLVWRVK